MAYFANSTLAAHDGNLIHAWHLQETSGACVDSVGSLDLTRRTSGNAPVAIDAVNGNGQDFEATSIQGFYNTTGFSRNKTAISISLWIKFESLAAAQYILFDDTGTAGNYRCAIASTAAYQLYLPMRDSAGGTIYYGTSTNTFSTGTWYHILAIWDTSANKIYGYVNGSEWINVSQTMGNFYDAACAHGMVLGSFRNSSNDYVYPTDGVIDELYIWDKALASSDATLLYNSGAGRFVVQTEKQIGRGERVYYTTHSQTGRGLGNLMDEFGQTGRGYNANASPYGQIGRGYNNLLVGVSQTGRGYNNYYNALSQTGRGRNRGAQASTAGYLVLHYIDGVLDSTTYTATLPYTYPAASSLSSSHVHEIVIRARNQYGLTSQNSVLQDFAYYRVELDAGGNVVTEVPSAPTFTATAAAGGEVKITADYAINVDDDPATQWAVWWTSTGVDPDPSGTPDYTETMISPDGVARLDYTTDEDFGDAATIKVLVRTRRDDGDETPSWVASTNTTPVSVTTNTDGPSQPSGKMAFGYTGTEGMEAQ